MATFDPAPTPGNALTDTVVVAVFMHPFTFVPVTVYVVVIVGVAITGAPVLEDRLPAGAQTYVDVELETIGAVLGICRVTVPIIEP